MIYSDNTMTRKIIFCFVYFMVNIIIKSQSFKFPDNFKFGVATAAYQIEGGWNASGKGENIWDRLTHEHPDWIRDGTNADIACDSYHKLNDDIEILKWLGVHFYRFSLSWSRLLPSGYTNKINEDGVRYYNELIDGLLQNNITPMVTLFHWDLPQPLQEVGGWPNIILADYFEDYARVAFQLFGDRVKLWITFNEPPEICQSGYAEAHNAPAYTSDGIGDYLCGRTLLLSHARAYHLYEKEFKAVQKGRVGITINANWYEPATDTAKDLEAAERRMQMTLGWWAHPIFSETGDYPEIFKQQIAKNSKQENFPRTRLIPFTKDEIKFIQGTHDFFGLNHYTSLMAAAVKNPNETNWKVPSFAKDIGVNVYTDPTWPDSAAPWLKVVPWGFRKLLKWIKDEYNNPEIIITENGYADHGELNDEKRMNYYVEYLNAVLEAIHYDQCNVTAYTAWSSLDNFEWRDGYSFHFGLFKVDFDSPNRTRTAKESAKMYQTIIKTHNLPPEVILN